jgi:hypothetical protein
MKHSCCWVEIGGERFWSLLLRDPRMATERSAKPRLQRRSHVDGLEIHWGLVTAPVLDIKMYGAGLTGGNAD